MCVWNEVGGFWFFCLFGVLFSLFVIGFINYMCNIIMIIYSCSSLHVGLHEVGLNTTNFGVWFDANLANV